LSNAKWHVRLALYFSAHQEPIVPSVRKSDRANSESPARRVMRAVVAATGLVLAGCHSRPLARPAASAYADPVAPDSFIVAFETTRGRFDVLARRVLAPASADRLYQLASHKYYDGARVYRVVPSLVAQFGLAADPAVTAVWYARPLREEPNRAPNRRGMVGIARREPAGRWGQLFIDLKDNVSFDTISGRVPPVGEVIGDGMTVVESLYSGYGEQAPRGQIWQDSLRLQGEPYARRNFPLLDAITRAWIAREWR
jgi:peptidyl-prolyl cis-trans isomerase A (cyclophilin A)